MTRRTSFLALLPVTLALSGCGTVHDLTQGGPRMYGGVRQLRSIGPCSCLVALGPCALPDFVVSAVADTALLPISIPVALSRRPGGSESFYTDESAWNQVLAAYRSKEWENPVRGQRTLENIEKLGELEGYRVYADPTASDDETVDCPADSPLKSEDSTKPGIPVAPPEAASPPPR